MLRRTFRRSGVKIPCTTSTFRSDRTRNTIRILSIRLTFKRKPSSSKMNDTKYSWISFTMNTIIATLKISLITYNRSDRLIDILITITSHSFLTFPSLSFSPFLIERERETDIINKCFASSFILINSSGWLHVSLTGCMYDYINISKYIHFYLFSQNRCLS